MERGSANGITMEKSTTRSSQKKDDESGNDLRNEVLKVSGNDQREKVFSAIQYKLLNKEAIKAKYATVPKLVMDGYEFNVEFDMDEESREKARNELRETPEIVAEALAIIREIVKEDPDLVVADHDEFYAKFLRPCKWYPKSAFHLMQRFYRFRNNYHNVLKNLTPLDVKDVIIANLIIPLPKRCINGCRLVVIHGGQKWKPKEISLNDLFKGVMITLEGALLEPKTQISGVQVIIDMEGLSLSQVTYFTPRFASMATEWVQRCLPCRLKNIHIINQPFIFNMVFAIFKPFLAEKLRKRIHFHGSNRQNLLASIGREALPQKYGGDLNLLEDTNGENIWKYFYNFQEEFEDSLEFGYLAKK